MDERLSEHIRLLKKYLGELHSLRDLSKEELLNESRNIASCERYFQTFLEMVISFYNT